MKKEIPILYSTPMVQAILQGRKTMTRRICKDNSENFMGYEYLVDNPTYPEWEKSTPYTGWVAKFNDHPLAMPRICPYGQPGDLLWGRESWQWIDGPIGSGWYGFKADTEKPEEIKWKPSIHMPKEAARIWQENTGVKIERVADICEADAIAEGVIQNRDGSWYDYINPDRISQDGPISSFISLWQSINGKPSPVHNKLSGKSIIASYEVYAFNDHEARVWHGEKTYRGKPLTVIINPWVWCVSTKNLSTTGKPEGLS